MIYLLPILAVAFGFAFVVLFNPTIKSNLKLLLAFSGAFLLSITVFELIPHLYHDHNGKTVGLFIMLGILLQIFLEFFSKGAEVIFEDAHVSGHAYQEELKLIHSLVKPKYFIPIHGEYKHMKKHAELAEGLGMKSDKINILAPGDVFEINYKSAAITGHIDHQPVYVDGLGVGDVGDVVLRDRQKLSQDGLITVVVTLSQDTREVLAGPDIVSRGFVYVRESTELMDETKAVVIKALDKCRQRNIRDWGKIKSAIRDALRDFLWMKTRRNPMILPVLMEVKK